MSTRATAKVWICNEVKEKTHKQRITSKTNQKRKRNIKANETKPVFAEKSESLVAL
jgi:hypothetical protein